MSLTNFGAVLSFAEELEISDAAFFRAAAGNSNAGDKDSLFEEFARASDKQAKVLERVRRENVTEMILEPIEGLSGDDFAAAPGDAGALDAAGLVAAATGLETRARDFYAAASAKLGGLPEVARELKRLGKKRGERLARLS